ncbi:MAG: Pyrroloquinoline quinone (PQQ) biosynthesis protein C [Chloroflexi bacterium]|jgi:pyrroloquinoline-quinone synthase|nr:MAG: Pyrroloquinoline quinone (PQQ) biosynthesis protein C [Chloroflexota bacterium]
MSKPVATNLERIVERWHLQHHPFYTAWSAGTLPATALQHYAAEWGAFIGAVPDGWRTLGVHDHADEEVEHARLWGEFASELGVAVRSRPQGAQSQTLVTTAHRLFADPATAIGALFAFEAQQPHTAQAKLQGLNTHYASLGTTAEYFAVHAQDYGEATMLEEMAASLSPSQRSRAEAACEELGGALWTALSDVQASAGC